MENMYHYQVYMPQLEGLVPVVERLQKQFEPLFLRDMYNLGRDPKLLSITANRRLTDDELKMIADAVPFRVRIVEHPSGKVVWDK